MTRKDYELIARHLNVALDKINGNYLTFEGREIVCDAYYSFLEAMGAAFGEDNTRYNHQRFLRAALGDEVATPENLPL